VLDYDPVLFQDLFSTGRDVCRAGVEYEKQEFQGEYGFTPTYNNIEG
jgi:hypothetical protein